MRGLPTGVAMALLLMLGACGGSDDGAATDTDLAQQGASLPDCYAPAQLTGNDVASHACSWAHAALGLQRALAAGTPFGDAAFTSTHNSFNSSVYPGLSGKLDPNQRLSLSEQLSLDMDSIELDLHWVYNAKAGGKAPVVCHGLGAERAHLGCSPLENTLQTTLTELASWLASPDAQGRVIWIDLEDVLADPAPPSGSTPSAEGHAQAVAQLEAALGPYLYRPPADGACHPLPLELTRRDVLAAGKQVVLTSGCGMGSDWTAAIFDIRSVRAQKANDGFAPAPDCGAPAFTAEDYAQRHTRIWEDNTKLSALTDPSLQAITAADLRAMLACGINTVSLDGWQADDARYPALVWSWAEHQPDPAAGRCALLDADGHFHAGDCAAVHPHACYGSAGWQLSAAAAWDADACDALDARYAVPASASAQAALATRAAGTPVWVHYRASDDGRRWQAGAPQP